MALTSPNPFGPRPVLAAPQGDFAPDPLWEVAKTADARAPDVTRTDPSQLWSDLAAGYVRPHSERLGPTRSYVILSAVPPRSSGIRCPLTEAEATVLLRVLCGDQQKVISTELRIAHSTASKRCAQAIEKLDLTARSVPLPVVVAAQSAAGVVSNARVRHAPFAYEGAEYMVASIRRPLVHGRSPLTVSEQSIAQLLVEGLSRWEIAKMRATSVQTVSCQLRSIFAKFQATGRYGLTRRATELGWFDGD